jgi:hypothetical protein
MPSQQPTINSQQPTANSQQSTANSQQPTVNSQQQHDNRYKTMTIKQNAKHKEQTMTKERHKT